MGQIWVSTGISGGKVSLLWQPVMTKVKMMPSRFTMSIIPWAALNRSSLVGEVVEELLDRGKMSPVRRKGKDIARCFKVRIIPGCLGSCSQMEDWQRC